MSSTQAIKRILVVASSGENENTVRASIDLADKHDADISILICVQRPSELRMLTQISGRPAQEVMDEIADQKLGEINRLLRSVGSTHDIKAKIAFGETFVETIRHVIHHDIDMVVKSAMPLRNVRHLLFSSADQHLLRKCPCPVWLRLPDSSPTMSTIIAAVDLDDWDAPQPDTLATLNRRVLDMAMQLAGGQPNAKLHVINAWEAAAEGLVGTFSSSRDLQEAKITYTDDIIARHTSAMDMLVDQAIEHADVSMNRIETHVLRGTAQEVITDYARNAGADVVVMGTVARTGLSGIFIGNTAEDILNSLECSVLTVKPEGFVSPVLDLVS